MLQKWSELKGKNKALLKSRDTGAILQSLGDAEQRLAVVRVNSAANETRRCSTSFQKEPTRDEGEGQAVQEAAKSGEDQEPGNGARSMCIEELDINSQAGKTKSNNYCVCQKRKSTTRPPLGAKGSEITRKLKDRLDKLKCERKQSEIADLQEEQARKARIAE